nr:Chain A, 38-mer peptide [synthetic construct]
SPEERAQLLTAAEKADELGCPEERAQLLTAAEKADELG